MWRGGVIGRFLDTVCSSRSMKVVEGTSVVSVGEQTRAMSITGELSVPVGNFQDWEVDAVKVEVELESYGARETVFLNPFLRPGRCCGLGAVGVGKDDSVSLLQQGETVWVQEDGLASITDIPTSELPLKLDGHSAGEGGSDPMGWLKGRGLNLEATLFAANVTDERLHLFGDGQPEAHADPGTEKSVNLFLSSKPDEQLYCVNRKDVTIDGYTMKESADATAKEGSYGLVFGTEKISSETSPSGTKAISTVVPRRQDEVVNTQTKILGNRDALYEYLSMNFIFLAAVTPKPTQHPRARRQGRVASALEVLWLTVLLISCSLSSSTAQSSAPTPSTTACPLDFTLLNQYPSVANTLRSSANNTQICEQAESGLEAVISLYLQQSGFFLIPQGTSKACITAYQTQLQSQGVPSNFNLTSSCKVSPFFSERGTDLCHNIQSAQDLRNMVPTSQLTTLNTSCSGSLQKTSDCGACNSLGISPMVVTLNNVSGNDNLSCVSFLNIYTIAVANSGGPRDASTVLCLLYIAPKPGNGSNNLKFIGVGVGGMLFLCLLVAFGFGYRYWRKQKADREARKKRTRDLLSATSVPTSSINWFDIDELKRATGSFSRHNILGTGGFGNVYKGTLPDGSVVAVKRFKNCSPAGDKDFVHEVEMISSVKHRHLVEIRGCCVDSSSLHGHQRMIVYDLMSNGSLQDHLFLKEEKPEGGVVLTWAMRKKIAIGMAKGLAYLHHDAVPAIFHRDIKSSNILLDDDWNARLADFGLAKFTPEGVSHVTTRVAGTYGYVAPEYALYGQLTEKSDVYSFGMVILELVSGRKALSTNADDPPHTLLSDWAWPLVKQGRWRALVDPRMGDDIGSDDEMERFILVGLLSAHPQVFYRPSIDQALKMLENDAFSVPSVPDRPLPFTSNQAEISQALSQESLDNREMSRRTGYSSYSFGSVSVHSSDYSGSFPTSWYERKVSSDRSQQETSNAWSAASASQPSSFFESKGPVERPQHRMRVPMSGEFGHSDSLDQGKVSPDRTQDGDQEKKGPQIFAGNDDLQRKVSPDRTRDDDLQKIASPNRTRDDDLQRNASPDRTRADDLEKGVSPDRTRDGDH